MSEPKTQAAPFLVEPEQVNELLTNLERIEYDALETIDRVKKWGAARTDQGESAAEATPEASPAWDVSPAALENYDAVQLVALRNEHRADGHDIIGCPVCDVLLRRLGQL